MLSVWSLGYKIIFSVRLLSAVFANAYLYQGNAQLQPE